MNFNSEGNFDLVFKKKKIKKNFCWGKKGRNVFGIFKKIIADVYNFFFLTELFLKIFFFWGLLVGQMLHCFGDKNFFFISFFFFLWNIMFKHFWEGKSSWNKKKKSTEGLKGKKCSEGIWKGGKLLFW